jgi:ADP-ribose pyrophosphatase YjhB (NUDIX family)
VSKYPNTYFRVSVKAIIRDEQDRVLVAKEYEHDWSLPGGGVDHGEDPLDALRRELKEEICADNFISATPRGSFAFYVEEHEAWLMWMVYDVKFASLAYACGPDVKAVEFKDVSTFVNGKSRSQQLTYKAVFGLAE